MSPGPRTVRTIVSRIEDRRMMDLLYIALTLGFFALMLLYVAACERLGHKETGEEDRP